MDLKQLKETSDLSYDIALQKQNALSKATSDLLTVYNGHIFTADAETICLVTTLSHNSKTFYVLDTNKNPVEIKEPSQFLELLIAKNQSALNTYHALYRKIKDRKI
jgi:hypothetical protein